MLLLPRQHAHAFLHEVSLQVSSGRVSLRRILMRENRRGTSNEAEYEMLDTEFLTTTVTSTCSWNTRKQIVEDILIQITVANRGPETAASTCCRLLVPQYLVVGQERNSPAVAHGAIRRRSNSRLNHPRRQAAGCTATALPTFYSPKMKPTPAALRLRKRIPYVKDAINDYVVQGIKEAVNPPRRAEPRPRPTIN